MLDIIVGLLSLILLFFLPGFLLALAIWPKKDALSGEFDLLFKCVIGIVMSMLISIFAGIVLYGIGSFAAPPGIQSLRLWVVLGASSVILGIIAWRRGGLHEIVKIGRVRMRIRLSLDEKIGQLSAEKSKLQDKIALMESEEYKFDQALIEEAAVRIPVLKEKIAEINRKIDELIENDEKNREGRTS